MKRIPTLIVKWFANKLGYKIAMLKASNGTTIIEGDKELLRYVDISGYFFKKEPLSRIKPSKTPTSAKEMFLAEGFTFERDISAGEHHYGIMFKKQ